MTIPTVPARRLRHAGICFLLACGAAGCRHADVYPRWAPNAGESLAPPPTAVTIVDLRDGHTYSKTWAECPYLAQRTPETGAADNAAVAFPPEALRELLARLPHPVALGPKVFGASSGAAPAADRGYYWILRALSVFPGMVEFPSLPQGRDGDFQLALFLRASGLHVLDFVVRGDAFNRLAGTVQANEARARVEFRVGDTVLHHVVVIADYRAPNRWAPTERNAPIGAADSCWLGLEVTEGDPFWYWFRTDVYEAN